MRNVPLGEKLRELIPTVSAAQVQTSAQLEVRHIWMVSEPAAASSVPSGEKATVRASADMTVRPNRRRHSVGPDADLAVVLPRRRQQSAGRVEGDGHHSAGVAVKGERKIAVVADIPQFDGAAVKHSARSQVSSVRGKSQHGSAVGVAGQGAGQTAACAVPEFDDLFISVSPRGNQGRVRRNGQGRHAICEKRGNGLEPRAIGGVPEANIVVHDIRRRKPGRTHPEKRPGR